MATITAAEIMNREVKTIPAEATLREAAEMLTLWDISGAPVVDDHRRVIGILSESDLLSEAKKRAALPRLAAFGVFLAPEEALQRIYHDGATLLVEEVMSKNVVTARPETPLSTIGELLLRKKINRLPVVDEDEKLLGIVTREDVLHALFRLPKPA